MDSQVGQRLLMRWAEEQSGSALLQLANSQAAVAKLRQGVLCREGQVGQRLLLRWAEEQWAGALQRMATAQAAVAKLKDAARAAAVKQKDTRFTLEVHLGL